MRATQWLGAVALLAMACSSPTTRSDAGDVVADASPPRVGAAVAALPVDGPAIPLTMLDGPADVVIDRYGWPHIYGTTMRDVGYLQGYMAALQRMPQMEMMRRASMGRLAEVFGSVSASTIERDIAMRVIGINRVAGQTWAMVPPGRTRAILEGYARGVNAYLAQVRAGAIVPPDGAALLVNQWTPDWTEVDSLAVGRLLALSQSYMTDEEIRLASFRDAERTVFAAATDPEVILRRGFAFDLYDFTSPAPTAIVPGFYTTTRSTFRPNDQAPVVAAATYRNSQRFLDRVREVLDLVGGRFSGSNNYVVAGSHSANGHAMLESDPHLGLSSPGIWWGVHLVVTDGPDAVQVAGVALPGTPGVMVGFTANVAWGPTNAYFDAVDVYLESVTAGTGGAPDTVRFNGQNVAITTVREPIANGFGQTVMVPVELVPHHGPVLPAISAGAIQPRTGTSALTVRWIGHHPTFEMDTLMALSYARNVDEARAAMDTWELPAMNFVFADSGGRIAYSTQSNVPVRDARARSWDPVANPTGTLPCSVLPGTGEYEWVGRVAPAMLPQAADAPASGFIATANNDQAGLSFDGNPLNDAVYLGCAWAYGWRGQRITERLAGLGTQVQHSDMVSVQGDHRVLAGGRFRPFLDAAFTKLERAWTTPGSEPTLASLAITLQPRAAQLRAAHTLLMNWSLDGESGIGSGATVAQQSDSAATAVFHAWVVRLVDNTFTDEITALGLGLGGMVTDRFRVATALRILEQPTLAHTYVAARADSSVWDDLRTTGTIETREQILLRSFDEAVAALATRTSNTDPTQWRWGSMHTVRFDSMIPGSPQLSIPRTNDPMFSRGFPRAGGMDVVDASEPGTSDMDFSYGAGPSQRFTVEMDPAGPHALNALPGGEDVDLASTHHADEAEAWRTNQPHPVPFREAEVVSNAERHLRFERAP